MADITLLFAPSSAASVRRYRTNDRVIVNRGTVQEPQYFVATVLRVTDKRVAVQFDDGMAREYPNTNSPAGLQGFAAKIHVRRSMIPQEELIQWLRNDENMADRGEAPLDDQKSEYHTFYAGTAGYVKLTGAEWLMFLEQQGDEFFLKEMQLLVNGVSRYVNVHTRLRTFDPRTQIRENDVVELIKGAYRLPGIPFGNLLLAVGRWLKAREQPLTTMSSEDFDAEANFLKDLLGPAPKSKKPASAPTDKKGAPIKNTKWDPNIAKILGVLIAGVGFRVGIKSFVEPAKSRIGRAGYGIVVNAESDEIPLGTLLKLRDAIMGKFPDYYASTIRLLEQKSFEFTVYLV